MLHPYSDFIGSSSILDDSSPSYWYEGRCPNTGGWLRLPRTALAEAIGVGLMQQLAEDESYQREGKMYGVLLVETPGGEPRVLKAFSGLLNGDRIVAGWVPAIPGRDRVAQAETETLKLLEAMKQELIVLQQLPARQQLAQAVQEFEQALQHLGQQQRQRQQIRQQQRQQLASDPVALADLDEQSRRDGRERRQLKCQRDAVLQPLQQEIEQADLRMRALKQQRRSCSRQLQMQMHAHYWLTNFWGESRSLEQLIPEGIPTGTGDCCAPKLLHYAASHRLRPLAMAEFWWGPPPPSHDKAQGEFYGACVERCQPLMGFLLSGIRQGGGNASQALLPLYEDEWLVAVDKPAGLLSVPGRTHDRQDSVLTRLRRSLAVGEALMNVHRLDQDTSGVLLLAKDRETHRHLSRQFQQRQVCKVYEAVLAGPVVQDSGTIDLPLWSDPDDRPYQKVDWQRGKPSQTHFQVLARETETTRLEFVPVTGRTHQIRVHAASGLGVPILGDRLYGTPAHRLQLHAKGLGLKHPQTGQLLQLHADVPF